MRKMGKIAYCQEIFTAKHSPAILAINNAVFCLVFIVVVEVVFPITAFSIYPRPSNFTCCHHFTLKELPFVSTFPASLHPSIP